MLTACLTLCSPKEEEEGRGHRGTEQPRGRPSVMEKQSGKGGGGLFRVLSHLARILDSGQSPVSLII